MKILTVTSGKGGVGKTTVAANIARQLSLVGLRVLIVDFDIHNKGMTGLFLARIPDDSLSVLSVVHAADGFRLDRIEEISSQVEPIELRGGNLRFLPAARPREMIEWVRFHADTQQIVEFFRAFFERLGNRLGLDVVLLDCYGGIDSLTVAATGVADDTIIINEPDVITFSGTLTRVSHRQLRV